MATKKVEGIEVKENMEVKGDEATKVYYLVKNTSQFVMMFPIGNAFLYPGLECVVDGSVVTDSTKAFWESSGTSFVVLEESKAKQLIAASGIFGTK